MGSFLDGGATYLGNVGGEVWEPGTGDFQPSDMTKGKYHPGHRPAAQPEGARPSASTFTGGWGRAEVLLGRMVVIT